MLDPRHLRVLREVARSGSYSAAARELGYTQPAITQQMRALERATGAVLTVRTGRVMRLTAAGEVLARHAAGILGAIDAAEQEVAAVAGLRAGRVRLAAFPSGSAKLVPQAVAAVVAAHPGVAVSLTEAEPPEALAALRAGECDIALTFRYDDDNLDLGEEGALAVLPLGTDLLAAVLPREHPRAGDEPVRLADLAEDAWIAGCPRCRSHLVSAAARAGFEPHIAFATDDLVAVQGLVAAGLGVALVPSLALESFRNPGVAVRRVHPVQQRTITALTWPELRRVPAVARMLTALAAAAGPLPAA